MRRNSSTWLLAIFLASAMDVMAANTAPPSYSDISFSLSPVSDKLSQQSVRQTFQDSRGALWFVTQEGLNRYTGKNLEVYRYSPSDATGLSSNIVTQIVEDNYKNLWIATLGGGLNRYDYATNSFETIRTNPTDSNSLLSDDISTLHKDLSGRIWLGHDNAYSVFDPATRTFRHYIPSGPSQLTLGKITDFAETPDGTLWAGTQYSGLIKINSRNLSPENIPLRGNQRSFISISINTLHATKDGVIWIGTAENGLILFKADEGVLSNYLHNETDINSLWSNEIESIYGDRRGQIWVGTHRGLHVFIREHSNFVRFTTQNSGLPEDLVFSIYQSREGLYWIGTLYGLASGSKNHFKTFNNLTSGLSSDSVNAFAITNDDNLWVGTDQGLNRLEPDSNKFQWINRYTSPSISSDVVMSLLSDNNSLWIGTFDGGLNKLDLTKYQVSIYKHDKTDKTTIGADGITSILKLRSDTIIFGTYGGGLSILKKGTNEFVTLKNDPRNPATISSNYVLSLYEDSFGHIWVGTENGLNKFDENRLSFQRFNDSLGMGASLESEIIWEISEDKSQDLWIGSAGNGLITWPADARKQLRPLFINQAQSLPLPSANIYGIQVDRYDNIWASHNRGVSKIEANRETVTNYTVNDGLQGLEFNMGASFEAKDGTVYFGGNRGFSVFNPSTIEKESPKPNLTINSIEILNKRAYFDNEYSDIPELHLSYKDRFFSIEVFANDYTNPDAVLYAYKLEGINPEWNISPDARIASFSTLPPGTYNLKFGVASPSGIWNWDAINLPLVVHPAPWLSPTAYAIYSSIIALFVFAIFLQIKRRSLLASQRQKELEQKIQERTADLQNAREAAESANQAKSDFLATVSHEIRTPLHGILGMTDLLLHSNLNVDQKRLADSARRSGESLLSLINNILDFSKIEAAKVEVETIEFSIAELIDDICHSQSINANNKRIQLINILDQKTPQKLLGDAIKIRQILTNLLSNAIKFTHEGKITVSMHSVNTEASTIVSITVKDTGIGMDEATQQRVFEAFTQADASTTRQYGGTGLGLSISRDLTTLLGGDINIFSEPNVGTSITVSFPLGVSIQSEEIPAKYVNTKAILLSSNNDYVDMIVSHLAYLGIESYVTHAASELTKKHLSYDLIFVDQSSLSKELVDDLTVELRSDSKKVFFTNSFPVADSYIHEEWTFIPVPLTISELSTAINSESERSCESTLSIDTPTNDTIGISKSHTRILVAEDVEVNQRIIKEILEILDVEAEIASNGKEAIELFKSSNFDLIFMDCQMPVLDGYHATSIIRSIEKSENKRRTPIIALSAGTKQDEMEKCKISGMDDYLPKPFMLQDIKTICNSFLPDHGFSTARLKDHLHTSPELTTAPNRGKNQNPVIDLGAIENIRYLETQSGKPILPIVLKNFNSQALELIEDIKKSISSADNDNIKKLGHALKSMSANIGAVQLREIAINLENFDRHNEEISEEQIIDSINCALDKFNSTIEELILA